MSSKINICGQEVSRVTRGIMHLNLGAFQVRTLPFMLGIVSLLFVFVVGILIHQMTLTGDLEEEVIPASGNVDVDTIDVMMETSD